MRIHIRPRAGAAKLVRGIVFACAIGLCLSGCKAKHSPSAKKAPAHDHTARPAPSGPPTLVLGRNFVDAGVLKPQSTCEKDVTMYNAGAEELVIKKAIIACKCFEASFDRKKLGPGQSGNIKVKFLTLKHRGELSEKIGIVSNDPARVKLLTLRLEVPHELTTVPGRLHLGIVRPGQEVRRRIQVVAGEKADTKVLYAISSSESLLGRVIDPVLRKDKPAGLEVVLKAPSRPGTYRHDLTITTAYEKQPTVRLPVTVCVSESASASPDRADFGRLVRGRPVRREIELRLGPGIHLEATTVRPNVVDVKVSPSNAEGAVRLLLTPSGKIPYGPLRAEVHLKVRGKEAYTLALPVSGYVADESEAEIASGG